MGEKLSPEVVSVKDDSFWTLFCETGEPVYWLLSREKREPEKKPEPEQVKYDEGAAKL